MSAVFLKPQVTNGIEFNQVRGNPGFQWMLFVHFIRAIAEFEGFFIDPSDSRYPSIAQKNNNPGNLRPIGASTGFRSFDTPNEGWERLAHQAMLNINRGLTVREFFLGKPGVYPGYAPLGDNEPEVMENYINHVKNRTGINESLPLLVYFQDIATEGGPFDYYHRWAPPNR